jgi:GNAT superfamily N-acetyltransferase
VSLEIVAVDAADAEQLAAYHATYHAAHTHGREYATAFALEEVRAQLLTEGTGELNLAWSGLAGGEVVTSGSLWAPLDDNTHMATVEVGTRPADRRRGYGSAMLEHLVGEVRRLGRRTVLAEVSAPYDGPADGRGHPNVDFVLRRGFEFALGSVMRVLDLPADEGRLKRLAAEAEPHHRGYEFLQFRGAVPEDIIEQYGELTGAVAVEGRPPATWSWNGSGSAGSGSAPGRGSWRQRAASATPPSRSLPTGLPSPSPTWWCRRTTPARSTSGGRWCAGTTAGTGSAWPRRSATSCRCSASAATVPCWSPTTPRTTAT